MSLKQFFRLVGIGRNSAQPPRPPLGLDIELAADRQPNPVEDGVLAARLGSMPSLTREVFLLRAVDGMSFEEISKHLTIARWRVKSHMRRAITRLAAKSDGGAG